jgi:hypothetical protein
MISGSQNNLRVLFLEPEIVSALRSLAYSYCASHEKYQKDLPLA